LNYVRIEHDGAGGSRAVDVPVPLEEQPFAVGVPPLLVSAPHTASAVVFLEFPSSVRDTEPHPTPRRQFGVVLGGVVETKTSDGIVRRYSPGSVVLLEDTDGAGHVTTVIEGPFEIMFVALADEAEVSLASG
jgi:hypothetical protein